MATKKGTCSNCKRDDVTLVSGEHCGFCYKARRGLKGTEREEALAEVARKLQFHDSSASRAIAGQQELPDEEPGISVPTVARLVLGFVGADLDIYEALKAAAGDNRRDVSTEDALYVSMQAEAMCILERALQDRIWCVREQPAARREQPE